MCNVAEMELADCKHRLHEVRLRALYERVGDKGEICDKAVDVQGSGQKEDDLGECAAVSSPVLAYVQVHPYFTHLLTSLWRIGYRKVYTEFDS